VGGEDAFCTRADGGVVLRKPKRYCDDDDDSDDDNDDNAINEVSMIMMMMMLFMIVLIVVVYLPLSFRGRSDCMRR